MQRQRVQGRQVGGCRKWKDVQHCRHNMHTLHCASESVLCRHPDYFLAGCRCTVCAGKNPFVQRVTHCRSCELSLWNVPTNISCSVLMIPGTAVWMRSTRVSAAFLEYVMTAILPLCTCFCCTSVCTRATRTLVLPLPGPAVTRTTGSLKSHAACFCSLNRSHVWLLAVLLNDLALRVLLSFVITSDEWMTDAAAGKEMAGREARKGDLGMEG